MVSKSSNQLTLRLTPKDPLLTQRLDVPVMASLEGPVSAEMILETEYKTIHGELEGHRGPINAVELTSDSRFIISGSSDKTLMIWSMLYKRPLSILSGHEKEVLCLCVSSNNLLILSGSSDQTCKIWDFESRRELSTLSGHSNSVTSVAVSEGKSLAITGSLDRSLKIWTLEGQLLQTFDLHTEVITSCLTFENSVISSSADKTLKLWDLNSLTFVKDLLVTSVSLVSLTRDSKRFACAETNSKIKVFDLTTFDEEFELIDRARIQCIKFAGNGEVLACCSEDNFIYLWDLRLRQRTFSLKYNQKRLTFFAISSDSSVIVAACNDKTLRLWNQAERRDESTLFGHSSLVRNIDCDVNGKVLVSGAHDETVRLWDLKEKKESWVFSSTENQISACRAMKRFEKCFITGHEDGSIKVWGLKTLEIESSLKIHSKEVTAMDIDIRCRLASGDADGQIIIWDLRTRKFDFQLIQSSPPVSSLVFINHQNKLASAGDENFIKIWDLHEKAIIFCLEGHKNPIFNLCTTFDELSLVSSSKDQSIKLWNLKNKAETSSLNLESPILTFLIWSEDKFLIVSTEKTLKVYNFPDLDEKLTLEGHSTPATSLAQICDNRLASSSGGTIFIWNLSESKVESILQSTCLVKELCILSPCLMLSASQDKTIILWDLKQLKIERFIYFNIGKVFSVALTKDSQFIISGTDLNVVLIMNVMKKTVEARLAGHSDTVWVVSVSPDGKLIASGSKDKSIKLWNFLTRTETCSLSGHSLTVMSLAFTADSKTLVSGSLDKKLIVWNLESKLIDHIFEHHSNPVSSLVISSANQVYTASNDNNIKIFTLFPKKLVFTTPRSQNSIESLCFSHNEEYLAYAEFNTIAVFNTRSRKVEFTLVGHARNYVYAVRFADDSRKIVSGSGDGCIKTWDLRLQTEVKTISNDEGTVLKIEFLPIHRKLVCGLETGGLKVWDVQDGQLFYSAEGHREMISDLTSSESQELVASCSKDRSVKIWNVLKKKLEFSFDGLQQVVKVSLFLENDCKLVLGSFDKTVRIWDLETRNQELSLVGHTAEVECLCRFDRSFISGGCDGKIIVWDCKGFSFELSSNSQPITSLAQHNLQVISASLDFIIRIWDVANRVLVTSLTGHSDRITSLLALNESTLVSSSIDKNIKVWDLQQMKESRTFSPSNEKILGLVKISESQVMSCSLGQTLRTWNALEGVETSVFKANLGKVWSLLVSQEFLFIGTDNFSISCLCAKDFKEKSVLVGHTATVRCLLYSEKHQLLISGSIDNCVIFWDIQKHCMIESRKEHTHWVRCLEITSDHKFLISGSQDTSIKIWEISTRRVISTLKGHKSSVTSLKFSQTHRSLISASSDCNIIIWDLDNLCEVCSLKCHNSTIWTVLFIQNDSWFATGSEDKQVKIWDFTQRREIFRLAGHQGPVEVLLESRCKRFLISGSSDCTVKVWNLHQRRLEFTLTGHKDHVYCLALDSSGNTLFSGSLDKTVKVWDMFRAKRPEGQKIQVLGSESWIYKDFTCFGPVVGPDDCLDDEGVQSHWTASSVFDSYCQEKAAFYNVIDSIKNGSFENLSTNANSVTIGKYDLTLAHFLAFLGKSEDLKALLATECVILKDKFGKSPFFYGISKKHHKCIEVLMNSMIQLLEKDDSASFRTSFQSISQDLGILIRASPSKLVDLLNQVLLKTEPFLFTYRIKLPSYSFNKFSAPDEKDFKTTIPTDPFAVSFSYLPFEIPFIPGSLNCLELLDSLIACKDRQIFTTPFVSRFIDYEWKAVKSWVLCYSLLLFSNLVILVLLSGMKNSWELFLTLVCINCLLFMWELAQLVVSGLRYFTEVWNLLDMLRLALTSVWLFEVETDLDYLDEIVIMLNFIRGLTAFKLFDGTRFYIDLIFRSINDVKYFLLLFFYSNLMFGALYSVKEQNKLTFNSLWLDIYSLNFGMYEAENNSTVIQIFIFMSATFINLIVMLNLLISILGDSHDQFQVERVLIDNFEKAELCLEIQKMFFWGRTRTDTGFLHVVTEVGLGEENSWEGRLVFLQKHVENLGNLVSQSQKEVVACLNEKIDLRVTAGLDKNFAKLVDMESKIKESILSTDFKINENLKSLNKDRFLPSLENQKSRENAGKNQGHGIQDFERIEKQFEGIREQVEQKFQDFGVMIDGKLKDVEDANKVLIFNLEKRYELIEGGIKLILDKLS